MRNASLFSYKSISSTRMPVTSRARRAASAGTSINRSHVPAAHALPCIRAIGRQTVVSNKFSAGKQKCCSSIAYLAAVASGQQSILHKHGTKIGKCFDRGAWANPFILLQTALPGWNWDNLGIELTILMSPCVHGNEIPPPLHPAPGGLSGAVCAKTLRLYPHSFTTRWI